MNRGGANGHRTSAPERWRSQVSARRFFAGCATEPPPPPAVAAPAVSPDQLVGKWGFAAYHRDTDRARTIKEALAQCNKPYVIDQGAERRRDDEPGRPARTLSELVLKAGADGKTYLGPPGRRRHGRRPDRHQRRAQFLHDHLRRPRQRRALRHLGVRALRPEEGVRRRPLSHLQNGANMNVRKAFLARAAAAVDRGGRGVLPRRLRDRPAGRHERRRTARLRADARREPAQRRLRAAGSVLPHQRGAGNHHHRHQ